MELTKQKIEKFSIRKISFNVKENAPKQLSLKINKKINCKLNEDRKADRVVIRMDISVKSIPEGLFSFTAVCRAIISTKTHDISDEELKEQINQFCIPMVDKEAVERIKRITSEMNQAPLDLTTNSSNDEKSE